MNKNNKNQWDQRKQATTENVVGKCKATHTNINWIKENRKNVESSAGKSKQAYVDMYLRLRGWSNNYLAYKKKRILEFLNIS